MNALTSARTSSESAERTQKYEGIKTRTGNRITKPDKKMAP